MEKDQPSLLKDEDVLKIAQKHGVSAGQILIRYQVEKGRDHSRLIFMISKVIIHFEEHEIFSFSLKLMIFSMTFEILTKTSNRNFRIRFILIHNFSGNAVLAKSGKLSRMKENLDIFQFSLDSIDMECLNNLYKKVGPNGYRAFDFRTYSHSPYFPFELS